MGLETFFLYGTLISIAGHHVVWTSEPSPEQLENEKYWETQIKLGELQRKNEENLKNVA